LEQQEFDYDDDEVGVNWSASMQLIRSWLPSPRGRPRSDVLQRRVLGGTFYRRLSLFAFPDGANVDLCNLHLRNSSRSDVRRLWVRMTYSADHGNHAHVINQLKVLQATSHFIVV